MLLDLGDLSKKKKKSISENCKQAYNFRGFK